MGARLLLGSYALAMAELLGAEYFGNRIIAQADGAEVEAQTLNKRLASGLEGREPVAVILDDSSAVWPHDRRNLLVAERYVWFPTVRTRGRGSLLDAGRDDCPRTGMLAAVTRTLDRIHTQVFARIAARAPQDEWDARAVMDATRRRVLAGARVAFSRVIPLEADPRSHPLWRLAEQYGGVCEGAVGWGTTHVVATHGGTEKVMWAKEHGKFVVSPAWLECSCILWARADERRFPLPQ
ncbi:MAG: hypothetical protein J3K34DRAFT_527889 [Monoraphidium minutum]|nr:MAG: hypothetical protein J3K34DRAFT_527889 [Monoraphidium minutum]